MHEILIGGLIALIVIVQITVALNTSKKINLFKAIIPDSKNFETVKVYIPESQIKDIRINEILNNIKDYSSPFPANNEIIEIGLDDTLESLNIDYPDDDELFPNDAFVNSDGEILIWVGKDNEEQKIALEDLEKFEALGWKQIK